MNVSGIATLLHHVLNTPERGFEIIPFAQLKPRYYEPWLLQKVSKGRTVEKRRLSF
jgi:hypothetical protein